MKLSRILLPILMVASVFAIVFPIFAKADNTPPQEYITLTIRDGNTTAFSGDVRLPDESSADIMVTPTNSTTSVAVSPRSVLGILESLEASSTDFNITNLSYSSTYNSFLINCIAIPSGVSTPDCYDWTDAINGVYPQVGVDQQLLNNGDVIYLFFGSSHQVTLSANLVIAGQPFTATAQQYDLPSGSYKPLSGVTIGVGTSNPDFSFTELATSTVDTNGQAVFTLNATGTFAVGIKEDFYFPTVPIIIADATLTPPSTPLSSGGGGGGGISHLTFNIPNALTFISNNQNADGSFDSPYSTDWTAIAFATADQGAAKTKLRGYLLNEAPVLSSVTDYERHAMALEALGVNPYSGTSINYIAAITNAFDGTQIGTPADNDDIFALLALEHAGFTSSDPIIQKDTNFILSSQHPDGSWDGSPDLTGAAMQALNPLFNIPGVNSALGKAAGYLASTEMPDGGWGNIDSTSWVQTAINTMIETDTPHFETESAWTSSSGLFPTDALAKGQQPDGGVQSPNRVWSTSYAVAAASGKSWVTLLQSFAKPSSSGAGGAGVGGGVLGISTSTTATLTAPTATTTPETATTTLPIITIPTPIIKTPTTTPLVISILKPKVRKPQIKTQSVPQPQAVHKEVKILPVTSQTQTETAAGSSGTGLFGRIWHAITSFFLHLF